MEWVTIVGRLALAVILGSLIGAERSIAGKVAGMRTYALVSLAAAVFVIVSELVVVRYEGWADFDPLRVASQVVVGIGFLGAGLIILRQSQISGLTTAAGLWVAAGVGVAVGFGLVAVALAATFLALIIFTLLWWVEKYFRRYEK